MKSNTRGQVMGPPPGVILTILAVTLVAVTGSMVVDDFDGIKQEISENHEHFERYCTERFGEDASVYMGGGQGVHSGLHCEDEAHKPVHLGAVEPETWEAYKNGDATAEDVTNSLRDVGFMGDVGGWGQYALPAAGVGVAVLGIGLVQRYRKEDE